MLQQEPLLCPRQVASGKAGNRVQRSRCLGWQARWQHTNTDSVVEPCKYFENCRLGVWVEDNAACLACVRMMRESVKKREGRSKEKSCVSKKGWLG